MSNAPLPEDLAFECPRCGLSVHERYYGPCPSCRSELRRTLGTAARPADRTAFEPAMHVTPNAVASKG